MQTTHCIACCCCQGWSLLCSWEDLGVTVLTGKQLLLVSDHPHPGGAIIL